MKKKKENFISLLLILTLVTSTALKSQTIKKSLLLEGSEGNLQIGKSTTVQNSFSNSKDVTKNTYLSLSSNIGYFFSNNIVAGLGLNYNYWMVEGKNYYLNTLSSTYKGKSPNISFMPFVRFYFNKNIKNRFYAQFSPKINYQLNKYSNSSYNNGIITNQYSTQNTSTMYGAEGLIGFNHFFTSNLAFNSCMGYNYGITSNTNFESSFNNFVWNFGFSIFFPRKEKHAIKE